MESEVEWKNLSEDMKQLFKSEYAKKTSYSTRTSISSDNASEGIKSLYDYRSESIKFTKSMKLMESDRHTSINSE